MIREYEQTFEVPRLTLQDALVAYVRSKPEYYKDIVEDPAELHAHLTLGFFAYDADLTLSVAERMGGSTLSIRIKTHPLFFMDPLRFWRRYFDRVANNLRTQLRT